MDEAHPETEPGAASLDTDIRDIIDKLDVSELRADSESDKDRASSCSSQSSSNAGDSVAIDEEEASVDGSNLYEASNDDQIEESPSVKTNGSVVEKGKEKPIGSVSLNVDKTSPARGTKKKKGPLEFLKRHLSKESPSKPTMTSRVETMMAVQVDSLPQVFVTKFLGRRVCGGLWGIKHTRAPVDELVRSVQQMPDRELPLVQLHVSQKGIHSTIHSQNKAKMEEEQEGPLPSDALPGTGFQKDLLPIEFVSYAVQDTKFTRVFCLIVVRELSWRQKTLECLAYVLDGSLSARRLALSVALAFKQYAKTLEGKPYKFQVDLRPPHELEKELDKKDVECEA